MLSVGATRMRHVVDGVFGTVTASEPSFGVEATSVVQFEPPSVESEIDTLAAVLPPFVHVTVCDELPAHETAVFGAVTEKAPETKATVIVAFDAENPGNWAFHCHHIYHMNSGMMGAIGYTSAA